jgi:hypothetical protein
VLQHNRSLFWCWWGGRKRVSFPVARQPADLSSLARDGHFAQAAQDKEW